jgi:hypothetical protein
VTSPTDSEAFAALCVLRAWLGYGVGLVDAISEQRPVSRSDELVAFPFGLERRAARGLVREGRLTTTRIGRRVYTKRSALLALVDGSPIDRKNAGPMRATDPAAAARKAYAAPLRLAGGGG